MKVRNVQRHGEEEIELQMTPMIDIVFQLLIFFIMTFKIVTPEGDFNVRMPLAAPSEGLPDENQLPPIVLHMRANSAGHLTSISTNEKTLKGGFEELRKDIKEIINSAGGPDSIGAEATEVELECDYNLRFEYVIDAVTAVSGFIEGSGKQKRIVNLVKKIKFTSPKEPPKGS